MVLLKYFYSLFVFNQSNGFYLFVGVVVFKMWMNVVSVATCARRTPGVTTHMAHTGVFAKMDSKKTQMDARAKVKTKSKTHVQMTCFYLPYKLLRYPP
jgi:hypothetical protein